MKSFKLILLIIGLLIFSVIGWIIFETIHFHYQESQYYNIKLPEGLKLEKPQDSITDHKIGLIESKIIYDTLIVSGGGGSYNLYYWHRLREKGEIYIRAFEITQNIELSKDMLYKKTSRRIESVSGEIKFFEANSLIHEGTFGKYYPASFEIWFQGDNNEEPIKLTETKYLIDGWDR